MSIIYALESKEAIPFSCSTATNNDLILQLKSTLRNAGSCATIYTYRFTRRKSLSINGI